ncbi:MAG: FAD-dependent oxidoreductase [Coriobacteriales bacterium]|jgi:fumarate reductase flavoprotein subunit|nr:FAD-dependent oxidoreductase [Coriobacteriales bacterium]
MQDKQQGDWVSRRSFLAGVTGMAALGVVGGLTACAPATTNAGGSNNETASVTSGGALPANWDLTCDILVIGGGGSGLTAAAKAAELGNKVILAEKMERVGGDTALSSQVVQGIWTPSYEEGDTKEIYLEDLKQSHWATEKGEMGVALPSEFPLTNAWLDNCPEMYDWAEAGGMSWSAVTSPYACYYPQPQWDTKHTRHYAPAGGSLITVLQNIAEGAGVDIQIRTPVIELIAKDSGRVVGAWALDANERIIAIKATKALVLATGGFNADRGMMSRYLPLQGMGFCGGGDGNTGDGHLFVKALGGALNDMSLGSHWMVYDDVSPSVLYNGASMIFYGGAEGQADATDLPFLLINMNGERFMAETMGYKWVGYHTNNQPYHLNHIVFDSGTVCQKWFETATTRYPDVKYYSAETLDELAQQMQVPAETLATTIQRYNQLVDTGVDEDFGRSMRGVGKLETPPFRAVRMRPRHYTTYGGVGIDTSCRVLKEDGSIIPGLYAAGTVCGTLVEQEGLYYQGGNGQALTFGYLAGKTAATEESWE